MKFTLDNTEQASKNNQTQTHTHTKSAEREGSVKRGKAKGSKRDGEDHWRRDTQQKHTSKTKCGRKDWMKIISNYLEEGIGAGRSSSRHRSRRRWRTFPFGECKSKMAAHCRNGAQFRHKWTRICEERERGGSTLALEQGNRKKNERDSEGQNADSSNPVFKSVC